MNKYGILKDGKTAQLTVKIPIDELNTIVRSIIDKAIDNARNGYFYIALEDLKLAKSINEQFKDKTAYKKTVYAENNSQWTIEILESIYSRGRAQQEELHELFPNLNHITLYRLLQAY